MTSIVLELQKEAMSSSSKVTDLLRKSLVVARKLKIKEFEEWITQEMNGYKLSSINEIPNYREIRGHIQHFNPYHGWSPVIIKDEKVVDLFEINKVAEPVTEIENLVNSESEYLFMLLPQGIQNILSDYFNQTTQYQLRFGKSQGRQIVDTVRNIILEWSLKLEEDGIMGEGLSFNEKEKQEASKQNYNINNFYGNASGIQFQQNSPNSTQTMNNGVDVGQIADLIAKIKENLNQTGLSEEQQSVVESEVETVTAELVSAQPQPTVIQKSLQSIRTMLEGAGGNVIASGLTFMIDKLPF